MTKSVTTVTTPLDKTYAEFTQILRKILDSVTDLGYSIILLKNNTVNLLDEGSKLLCSFKPVVLKESKDLKLQCVVHLDNSAFDHFKLIHQDLDDRSYLKHELGPVGASAWSAINQVLITANSVKPLMKAVNATNTLTASMQVSVLNQVDNVLEYEDCYFSSSRVLILEIPNFFGTDEYLNLFCHVKMYTSERGVLVYKATKASKKDGVLNVKGATVISEPTPKPVSTTKSLFLDAVNMFGKMALDSMVP